MKGVVLMKIFKRIKKFIKRLIRRIKYMFNPDSLSKKQRKKIEKETKERSQYSWWMRFCMFINGIDPAHLKIKNA